MLAVLQRFLPWQVVVIGGLRHVEAHGGAMERLAGRNGSSVAQCFVADAFVHDRDFFPYFAPVLVVGVAAMQHALKVAVVDAGIDDTGQPRHVALDFDADHDKKLP